MTGRAGEFDYQDARRFKYTRISIWDLYEERQSDLPCAPASSISETFPQIIQNVPHLAQRMLKDILGIRRCSMLLPAYLVVEVLASLIPAVSLWYSGQLLRLVASAMETRTVDTTVLVHFAVGHLICTAATRFLRYARACITPHLSLHTKRFYIEHMFHSSVSMGIAMMLIRLLSQLLVLVTVMWEQQGGLLLWFLAFCNIYWHGIARHIVWAATPTNEDFVRMESMRNLLLGFTTTRSLSQATSADTSVHVCRRALPDDLMLTLLRPEYRESAQHVGNDAVEFPDKPSIHLTAYISRHPICYPILRTTCPEVRNLYEIENIQNKMVDGTEPFPENRQSLRNGISVEFRCTILKLISRIYDPTEGTILIDDRDIKTFKLADLRAAMSILFQDYTQFPLSMRENIGLGNSVLAHDDDKVREAARLGGAEDFVDELPNGFDTYIDRPVNDFHGKLPEGTTTLFGQPVDSLFGSGSRPRSQPRAGVGVDCLNSSRTFMRSLVSESESSAGMLLFDEPSASLDPMAEHDLFERLRKLRGNKTMIFSTHRFGNLTQHADLIL
ncbi:P-loop containing nucleoside triphosphate hydrolase protein [Suillus lakei]|nr:P-loop containing nucleoside triphosphate hydrolase protein [Suillus lakei]